MCGIYGSLGLPLPPAAARRMLLALRHRGPDDWGVWGALPSHPDRGTSLRPTPHREPWQAATLEAADWGALEGGDPILGHTRLSILDPTPASHQPFTRQGSVLVHNGEVYNYVELRRELRSLGYAAETGGDTEVLLLAYLAWGEACVLRFNGPFAFAVWDSRQRSLFAARDRLGKKPFYFSTPPGGGLLFASEIKALWASGLLEGRPDLEVAARYLALGTLPAGDESFFDGVRQLPAGCALLWAPGSGARIRRYWEPAPTFDATPRDAARTLRHRLGRSVELRYRADVPVGLCLSGGVDSSSLLAAASLTGAPPHGRLATYSAVPAAERHSERREIAQVLERFPEVEATFLATGEDASAERFWAFLGLHDEPLASDGSFHQYLFMRRIRELGMKVMLSGQGADELFLGYPWYLGPWARQQLRRGRLLGALLWLAEVRRREGTGWSALLSDAISQLSRGRLEAHKRRRAVRYLRPQCWERWCAGAYRQELRSAAEWPRFHADQILRTSLPGLLKDEDRNSMANGVETRLPYLDPDLVEWALTLAPRLHLRRGMTKHLLRSAFADRLPREVAFSKRKQGFYVPHLHRFPSVQAEAEQRLAAATSLEPLVDRQALGRLDREGGLDSHLRWRALHLAVAVTQAEERSAEARSQVLTEVAG